MKKSDQQSSSKADDAALDLIRQLITLASGVLALSATFIEKTSPLSPKLLFLLALSWLFLIISVIGGIQTMSVIVKSRINGNDTWSTGRGRFYARTSKFGFVFGIALFVIFAFFLLIRLKPQEQHAENAIQNCLAMSSDCGTPAQGRAAFDKIAPK